MSESSSVVAEWIRRAEDDWEVVRMLQERSEPLWEIASFHAQQSAEKCMKAFLIRNGWKLKKTHDLTELLSDCVTFAPTLSLLSADCQELTPFALAGRYPAVLITADTCKSAIASAQRIRTEIIKRIA